jgi:hypothetical protein
MLRTFDVCGLNGATAPLLGSIAATFLRGSPPTRSNAPPM